jgi:hypothetical protein
MTWRGLVIGVCSAVGGGVAGYVLVVIWQTIRRSLGIQLDHEMVLLIAKIIGGCGGLLVGLAMFVVYIKWIFSTRLGRFRLLVQRVAE